MNTEGMQELLKRVHTHLTTPHAGRNAGWHSEERKLARAVEQVIRRQEIKEIKP